jgi:hypothetical protein
LKGSTTASNNIGLFNSAVGFQTLSNNTSGSYNTVLGYQALQSNTSGTENTAVGYRALNTITAAIMNTAVGNEALLYNTANANTAVGFRALRANTGGVNLAAVGSGALYLNTIGNSNTAIGQNASFNNTTGSSNTSIGFGSLSTNTIGSGNTALGHMADVATNNLTNATAIGNGAIVAASNSIQLGNTDVTQVKTSGAITASGFKTPNGTSSQYLMADGTVSSGSGGSGLTLLGKIIYVKNISGSSPSEIWTANYDGTGQVKINITLPTGIVFGDALQVSMSPNGQKIFFNAGPPFQSGAISSVDTDIYTCNIDGTNVVKIIDRGNRTIYIQGVY